MMHSIAQRRVTLRTLAVLAVAAVVASLLVRTVSSGSAAPAEAATPIRPAGADASFTTVFRSALGIEGLTGDRAGNLYTAGHGATGQGRVWRVGPDGGAGVEMFRVQPMVNEVNVMNGVGGIGRDPRSLPPGSVTITPNGRTAADTLCLDDVLVAHPFLEGADGIALDRAGNLYAAANERNAIVVVTREGRVVEFFRNAPDGSTRLRNGGPLEFPTSPFLSGNRLCVTNSDGNRRDNSPNTPGEAAPGTGEVAKVNCLDQPLAVEGLPLPVG